MKAFLIAILFASSLFAQAPITATIDSGETVSDIVYLEGNNLVGIEVSDDFNGDSLTILTASSASGTFKPIRNTDGILSFPVTAGGIYVLKPSDYFILRKYIKIQHNDETDTSMTHNVFLGGY